MSNYTPSVRRYKPEATVTLYTETGELVIKSTDNPNSEINKDIIEINTIRDKGADCPTFSVVLTRAKAWHLWVTANDLVKIEMIRPPENKVFTFFGLVDDVRQTLSLVDDTVQRSTTITGRGLGKAFIEFDVGVMPEVGYASPSVGWLQSNGIVLAGSSADRILEDVYELLAKNYVNYQWSNGESLYELMSLSIKDASYLTLLDDLNLIEYHGSFWALMKEIAEEPWMELYWEVEDGVPCLILRPTPYNEDTWNALPVHVLDDADITNVQIGRSDVETFTVFSVGAKALYSPDDPYTTLGVLPYWYEPNSHKYGIKRLHVESAYLNPEEPQARISVRGGNVDTNVPNSIINRPPSLDDRTASIDKKIWDFFVSKGMSEESVAGLIGNLYQESGLNPSRYQSGGGPGRGLLQWTNGSDRWQGLQARASQMGKTIWDLEVQLEHIWYEIHNEATNVSIMNKKFGGVNNVVTSTNVDFAADAYCTALARAGKPNMRRRKQYATETYNKLRSSRVAPVEPEPIEIDNEEDYSTGYMVTSGDLMSDLQKQLFNWNIHNQSMFNGVATIKGTTLIKTGDRVIIPIKEDGIALEFYVRSVSQTFVNFENWTTELGLVRGMKPGERFSPPWNAYEEFTGVGYEMVSVGGGLSGLDTNYPTLEVSEEASTQDVPSLDGTTSNKLVQIAQKVLKDGKITYVFGGPGMQYGKADCSQFTQYVYEQAGIKIGRDTGTQVTKGNKVAKSQLQPGDLVFFKNTYPSKHIYGVSHVGVYVGDGKFIHNSSSAKTVTYGNLNDKYWQDHWLMGRRV